MSEESATVSVVHDGFQVATNEGSTEAQLRENLASEPAPLDGTPEDAEAAKEKAAKKERSEAAAKLGKAGGRAAAESRAKAEDLDPDNEEKPASEANEGEEKHGRAQVRIERLARERAEERAARLAAEAEVARLKAERAPARPDPSKATEKAVTADGDDDEPHLKPEDHDTYEASVEAFVERKAERIAEKKIRETLEKISREAQEQAQIRARQTAADHVTKGFTEALEPNAKIQRDEKGGVVAIEVDGKPVDDRLLNFTPSFRLPPGTQPGPDNDFAELLLKSKVPHALMRYFSDDPQEVVRILSSSTPLELAHEFGLVEAQLRGQAPAQAPAVRESVSSAPPPIRPVRTSPQVGDPLDDPDSDFDSYYRAAEARDNRLRRGR